MRTHTPYEFFVKSSLVLKSLGVKNNRIAIVSVAIYAALEKVTDNLT